MQVTTIQIPVYERDEKGEFLSLPSYDKSRTIISFNPETDRIQPDGRNTLVIEVTGFGTGEGTFTLSGYTDTNHLAQILGLDAEDFPGHIRILQLGHAFVWMEPITWAHAIRDVLFNQ